MQAQRTSRGDGARFAPTTFDRVLGDDPRRVGPYWVGPELARGGMASVHVASMDPSGRTPDAPEPELFAIKLVLPELTDEADFVEMFLDEARIASRIRHPNVCRVFRFGEVDDALFLTMELLRGAHLGALRRASAELSRRADPVWHRVAARLVADACAGLHAAHELRDADGAPLDVVHRDVSPQNVFVCRDGTVKLLDFGIASASHRLHATNVGVVKGKFAYIAPERILSARSDRRSDLWSVGVVLWELLAGRALFRRASEPDTIAAVLRPEIPVLPGVPAPLARVMAGVLRADPAMRTDTALEMQVRLEDWIASAGGCERAEVVECLAALATTDRLGSVPVAAGRHAPAPRVLSTSQREARSREPTARQPIVRHRARASAARLWNHPPAWPELARARALAGPILLAVLAALTVALAGRALRVSPSSTSEPSLGRSQSSDAPSPDTTPTP